MMDPQARHGRTAPGTRGCPGARSRFAGGVAAAAFAAALLTAADPARLAGARDAAGPPPARGGWAPSSGARYVGVLPCGECHAGAFARWTGTKHARAWVALATGRAVEVARRMGRSAPSPEDPACLACHSTGAAAGRARRAETFHPENGVGCEACHGAGERYMEDEIMRDREKAGARGLAIPGRDTCMRCHRERPSHAFLGKKAFEYDAAWKRIAHGEEEPKPAGDKR